MPFGIFRPLLIEDLQKAGIKFKLWLADWFAWINNKMGGDLERIHKVGEYFIEVWKAGGVKNVEFVWASDAMDREYWKKVILIAKHTTVNRATRCLSIMGRKAGEMGEVAQFFYPVMQTTDIFHLEADMCQLGLDQRRANILAREVGPKLGWGKPVVVSHHMLMSLTGQKEPDGFDASADIDKEISSKMSKSKPNTCIFVHDTKEEIAKKINNAFCEPKNIDNNPLLDYAKHLVFRKFGVFKVDRPAKFGGFVEFDSFLQLQDAFANGQLHPMDLKNAMTGYLDEMIKPVREHFEKNAKARELYEFVKGQQITR